MSIYEKADQAPYFVLTENLTVIAYFAYENAIVMHICLLSFVFALYLLIYLEINNKIENAMVICSQNAKV